MTRIRIHNVRLLTMEPDTPIFKGELWVEGGLISYAGSSPDSIPAFDQEIDGENGLLLPGFVNAHAHSPMVFLRSMADDLPLQDWLHKQVFPVEEKLTEEQAYHFAKLAILEYLSSGITSSFEMYIYPYAIAKASVDLGFRTVICGALNNFTHSVEELEQQYIGLNGFHPLISMHLGFHGEYTTSEELLRGVAALAQQYKTPVFTHLSESIEEVEGCVARTGMTPPRRLEELGIWEYGGGGFHCIHLTEEDRSVFRRHGLATITCPGSNIKLASGIPSLLPLLDLPLGIGTDGAGSNNALDFFREMHLTATLQKIKEKDAAAFPVFEALHAGTVGGASILGLHGVSTLTQGQKADLVLIDTNQPNMQPEHNLAKNLVYSGSKSNVLLTMVAGQVLYHKGEYFVGDNPQDIYDTCNNIVRDLLSSL